MLTRKVSARWSGEGLNYIGVDSRGHEISMGRSDFAPSEMMLMGLAGCTGMDIVSILEKKRQQVTGVEIEVTGYQPDQYPKPYEVVEMKFVVYGQNLDPKAVARAIQLSEEKYCVVGQTMQRETEIKTSFEIKET